MNPKINTALIGYGLSGKVFHAPVITSTSGFSLSKIYTTKPESIRSAKKAYPQAAIVSDIGDILNDENINLVIVASPNTSHFSVAKEALISEKHVIIEKPFTVTSDEADNLIALAKRYGRVLSVYHNRRWDSDFSTVKKVIESRLLGNLVECEMHFDRFRSNIKENAWREECLPGSGILYDLGSHLLDQAQVLFGIPDSITADIRIQRPDAKVADNFEILLNYSGLKVTLKAGMLVGGKLPRYILLGDKGAFIKCGSDVQEPDLRAGLTPLTKNDWGREPEENHGEICTNLNGLNIKGKIESEAGDYRNFYINIYKAVTGKEELAVKPEQARNVIRLIELAEESSRNKRTIEIKKDKGLIK
ncbi:MAG: Gfo/Idh/MocA family oxidoreductase [Caulobacteraceae bacterium]